MINLPDLSRIFFYFSNIFNVLFFKYSSFENYRKNYRKPQKDLKFPDRIRILCKFPDFFQYDQIPLLFADWKMF